MILCDAGMCLYRTLNVAFFEGKKPEPDLLSAADVDGSHIKGLLLNMFHHFWPSLLTLDGFATSLLTPIVKATKGNVTHSFYTLAEYREWKAAQADGGSGYRYKYFKASAHTHLA